MNESTLIGRDQELSLISELFDTGAPRVALFRGPRGIGKSSLLAEAQLVALSTGRRPLCANGVENERAMPYAALHQLLRPFLSRIERLPEPQRNALHWAFGTQIGPEPTGMMIPLAVMGLLAQESAAGPLALFLDNANWLDRESVDALAFVARRPEVVDVPMVVAYEPVLDCRFEAGGFEAWDLEPLNEAGSSALLQSIGVPMTDARRDQILTLAEGSPLALVELARSGHEEDDPEQWPMQIIPRISDRLAHSFAPGFLDLPLDVQTIILIAALNDHGSATEAINAGRRLDKNVTPGSLSEAESTGMISVEGAEITFAHPVTREAVIQRSCAASLRAAHFALSEIIRDDRDRQTLHRAQSSPVSDEHLAAELEEVGAHQRELGHPQEAGEAYERAAELSETYDAAINRWLTAAELRLDAGQPEVVRSITVRIRPKTLTRRQFGRYATVLSAALPGTRDDESRGLLLVNVAEGLIADGQSDLGTRLLATVALEFAEGGYSDHLRERILEVERTSGLPEDHPLRMAISSHTDPAGFGPRSLAALRSYEAPNEADAERAYQVALALDGLGVTRDDISAITTAWGLMNAHGRRREAAQLLTMRSVAQLRAGRWELAERDAVGGARLAADTLQLGWLTAALTCSLWLQAARGELMAASTLLERAEQAAVGFGSPRSLVNIQQSRAFLAATAGEHEDAYRHLRRVFVVDDPAHHEFFSVLCAGELAESAVATGQVEDARNLLARLDPAVRDSDLPWIRMILDHAEVLLGDEDEAERRIAELAEAGYERSPFQFARLHLAHGAALRRRRRASASREPLRVAHEGFRALGATPWADIALRELRASGQTRRSGRPELRDELTPQELEIAQLAAAGLSNREIGQRLFVSHRTVGSHLYRLYPKLGVTSRQDLRAILEQNNALSEA